MLYTCINILDLVIYNPLSEFCVVSILPSHILTDHVAVSFFINYNIQSLLPSSMLFRKLKSIDYESFSTDIMEYHGHICTLIVKLHPQVP